jgi:ABC-type enterochelin transport system substrate-binding protein
VITELRLNSNAAENTARFWSAIFNVPAEALGDGRWRITPAAGPTVVVDTARVWETISRYVDVTVAVDAGAADRLRENGFEVAVDGSQAVDVNGCDNTVFLVQAP